MYQLVIANKNYSSWSMRPWVLMRALDIAFTEILPFHLNHGEGAYRKVFAVRTRALSHRRRCTRMGLAGHR